MPRKSEASAAELKLTLTSGDAALVMKPGGISELHRHKYAAGETVPFHVLVLTAIAMRIASDPAFIEDQLNWYGKTRRNEPLALS